MTIPFHSNTRQNNNIATSLSAALSQHDYCDDASFGRSIEQFERELASYCGARFAIGVASGTDALTIALTALKLPPHSEVINCGFGFYATAAAILRAGLTPVFVDTEPDSYLISPDAALAAITEQTSAILPVHMFGEPASIRELSQIAIDHELALIEDCAQAVGARHGDYTTGTFGDSAAFSFNWSKHLSCTSNGGAIVTNDEHQVETLRALRAYGSAGGFWHPEFGINSKLNPFEARVLSAKLPHLDGWISRRREIADRYRKNLGSCELLQLPSASESGHVYHKLTIRHSRRDELRAYLKQHGIGSMVCYPHLLGEHTPVASRSRSRDLTNAKAAANTALSIPIWPELTDVEVDTISEHIAAFCETP